jgi:hypothetical protein
MFRKLDAVAVLVVRVVIGTLGGQRFALIHSSRGRPHPMDASQPTPTTPKSEPMRLTDPRAMRALAHPVRLGLVEALTMHGQLTATEAGDLIDETPTTCSFHFRQLAKYGFVEEAGARPGRARPWQLVQLGWTTPEIPDDPSSAVAENALSRVTLDRYVDRHNRSREARATYPPQWHAVGGQSETVCWVTPGEALELDKDLRELFFRYRDRLTDPSRRPAGAEAVEVVAFTHLLGPPTAAVSQGGAGDKDHPVR